MGGIVAFHCLLLLFLRIFFALDSPLHFHLLSLHQCIHGDVFNGLLENIANHLPRYISSMWPMIEDDIRKPSQVQ